MSLNATVRARQRKRLTNRGVALPGTNLEDWFCGHVLTSGKRLRIHQRVSTSISRNARCDSCLTSVIARHNLGYSQLGQQF